MKLSNKGLDLIKQFEGCELKAYICPAGVLTIGYGHTGSDVKQSMVITESQATEVLRKDVAKFETGVSTITSGTDLNQNQFDALVSFAFNSGLNALKSSTLLRKVMAKPSDKTIALEFARWNKSGGKILPCLTTRRYAESKLYFS
ncbi:MAG: lysozyme [Bacteroidales bacterium]|jgi:lysozyme|nr:lysozyme [Bacteroidales bacterium]